MISNLNIAALGLNMILAAAILVVFVIRYRKTATFAQSLLWGVLISIVSNVIYNLIGSTLFPQGLLNMSNFLAALVNAVLMTLSVIGSYAILSGFQFKKGYSDESPVINAVSYFIIPILNLVMQSFNYLMFAFAINKGTASQFLNETFKQENLDALSKLLVDSNPLMFLEWSIVRILEILVITVIFTLIYKVIKSENKINFVKLIPAIGIAFGYYFVASITTLFITSFYLAFAIRVVVSLSLFFVFKPQLEL